MKTFVYRVKNDLGRSFSGILDAENKRELIKYFRKSDFFLVSYKVVNKSAIFRKRISFEELLIFTYRFSSLIDAGIPILSAMDILWKQSESRDVQIIISHLRQKIESGSTLAEALGDFPNVFSVIYRVMISVAEKGPGLSPVLRRLTEYLENQKKIRTRIKRATTYPTLVIGLSVVVTIALFIFVVPVFFNVLSEMQVELPYLTQLVMGISEFLRSMYFPILVIGIVLGLVGINYISQNNKKVSLLLDSSKLKVPILKRIFYMFSLSQFVRAFYMLVASGVPIVEGFEVGKSTADNQEIETAVEEVKNSVVDGSSLYDAFNKHKIFPVLMVEMIGVGEKSGSLPKLLERLAYYFEEELDYSVNKLLTILEPLLIVVVGGVVLITMLGLYLPMVSLWNVL